MAVQNFYFFGSYNSCPIEAITYLNASGITDPAIRDNYCKFVQELKDNGVYSLIDVLYPDLGSNASQNKLNAINPIDTDGAFRRTFSGGVTFSPITGTKGNGTNGYYDTKYKPYDNMALNTGAGMVLNVLDEGTTVNGVDLDCVGGFGNNIMLISRWNDLSFFNCLSSYANPDVSKPNTLAIGSYMNNRPKNSNYIDYNQKGSDYSTVNSIAIPKVNILGMSRNGTSYFSDKSHGGIAIFKNATTAQAKSIQQAFINMNARR